MNACQLIAAVGSPLTLDERLHCSGFAAQLDRLWSAGVHGVFVAGTMGAGPLLADHTYRELAEQAVALSSGKGKLMIGASDLSAARTLQRIDFLNGFELDGVVVLPPFFMRFSQEELIEYYRMLACESRSPLYLYDLPQRTYAKIESDTILTLAEHANIVGIKCSGDIQEAQSLISVLEKAQSEFKVIVAQPDRLHQLVAAGVTQHLDGIYALAPRWAVSIIEHTVNGRDEVARRLQAAISQLLETLRRHGGLSALSILMSAIGVPGQFAPRPFRQLTAAEQRKLIGEPIVQYFLEAESSPLGIHRMDGAEGNGSRRDVHVRDSIFSATKRKQ